jgi:hypothetical protein
MKSQSSIPLENLVRLDDYWKMQETIGTIDQRPEQSTESTEVNQHRATSRVDYTFFAQLPWDIPPTANTTCARYFYSVVAYGKTFDGEVRKVFLFIV